MSQEEPLGPAAIIIESPQASNRRVADKRRKVHGRSTAILAVPAHGQGARATAGEKRYVILAPVAGRAGGFHFCLVYLVGCNCPRPNPSVNKLIQVYHIKNTCL